MQQQQQHHKKTFGAGISKMNRNAMRNEHTKTIHLIENVVAVVVIQIIKKHTHTKVLFKTFTTTTVKL